MGFSGREIFRSALRKKKENCLTAVGGLLGVDDKEGNGCCFQGLRRG